MTRLVVIGASAGGIETLRALFRDLPADFPAPVCIVMHVAPESPGILPSILTRPDGLRVLHPRDGQPLRPGRGVRGAPGPAFARRAGRAPTVTRSPRESLPAGDRSAVSLRRPVVRSRRRRRRAVGQPR